ncbi:MAG: DNA repair protein RecO [Planctomycetota bacterium]
MQALVWKRSDLRESSRLITLWTRDRGRLGVLGKGAHRHNSALLGKIDFLNELDVQLSGRSVPLFRRVKLVHEPRPLRAPERYWLACHLARLFDACLVQEHPDPELFDLGLGAFRLAERSPLSTLPQITAGIELKLLRQLGSLPELDRCSDCGREGSELRIEPNGALRCPAHASPRADRISAQALQRARTLIESRGRDLPGLPDDPAQGELIARLRSWLHAGLEVGLPFRALALRA